MRSCLFRCLQLNVHNYTNLLSHITNQRQLLSSRSCRVSLSLSPNLFIPQSKIDVGNQIENASEENTIKTDIQNKINV